MVRGTDRLDGARAPRSDIGCRMALAPEHGRGGAARAGRRACWPRALRPYSSGQRSSGQRSSGLRILGLLTFEVLLAGCGGPQSALSPAGRDAERIANLFSWMAAGALVVWLVVMASAVYAAMSGDREHSERKARWFIVGGGIVFPTLALTALLVGGLAMLPDLLDLGPDEEPAVRVTAEQFWWRASYSLPDGGTVAVANELRLPVGRRVALAIDSPDVVHSFWVPSLAGKVDAIPGRTTYLGIEPTKPGIYRGACAEYCGRAHAFMAFHVVAMPPDEYAAWLAHQAAPATPPANALAREGAATFLAAGCGACHTVRGTAADGALGPDLTHVGGRRHVAGVLASDRAGFRRWLEEPDAVKPGAHMPGYASLADDQIAALVQYLRGLE